MVMMMVVTVVTVVVTKVGGLWLTIADEYFKIET